MGLSFDSVKVRAACLATELDDPALRELGVDEEAIEVALAQLVADAIAIASRYSERAAEELRAELL